MPITQGDVRLVKSKVMLDTPEGGGGPTGIVIADGVSNDIFPDVSSLDRVNGRVNVRQIHLHINTIDQSMYLGANMIVSRPPEDENISITLVKSNETFDTRAEAMARVEAYLFLGPTWPGILFGNHIAGMSTVSLVQRSDIAPAIGDAMVLVKRSGYSDEQRQYVRIVGVALTAFEFEDGAGVFQRNVVELEISDPLRFDMLGFGASRYDPSEAELNLRTRLSKTVVANATRYYGVVPLAQDAEIGDYSVKLDSIYTQLVPSAQVETPIADARTNQVSGGYVAAGGVIVQSINTTLSTTQAMFVGAAAVPGTVSIARGGVTLTDAGGRLYNGESEVGLFDYDNGVARLIVNVWGASSGTHVVTYTPAAIPQAVTQSFGEAVTAGNRSLTQVKTLPRPPARGSLSVSYAVAGNWYTLREDGTGALRGQDTSYGAGQLNYATSTVSTTFGALPDVGSSIIYEFVEAEVASPYASAELENGGKAFIAINSDGELSTERGGAAFDAATVTITWSDNGTPRTVTSNAAGVLSGYGTGTVNAQAGVIKMSPTTFPAPGTILTVTSAQATTGAVPITVTWGSSGGYHTADFGSNLTPGTVQFALTVTVPLELITTTDSRRLGTNGGAVFQVLDDGEGRLLLYSSLVGGVAFGEQVEVGTVNYTTGVVSVLQSLPVGNFTTADLSAFVSGARVPVYSQKNYGWSSILGYAGEVGVNEMYTYAGSVSLANPSGSVYFSGVAMDDADPITVELDALKVLVDLGTGFQLRNAQFTFGGSRHVQQISGSLVRDISATTGVGTPVGSVSASTGEITITTWEAGDGSTLTDWRGAQVPPSEGLTSPYAAGNVVFRTATAPLRPGSFSVSGSMLDGTAFSVTVDEDGKINHTRVKGRVNLDTGVVELYGVNPSNSDPDALLVDLTFLGISGVTTRPVDLIRTSTLRYNAVAYTYLPLNADLLGIDPVRLPSDGRVPIFAPGYLMVFGRTGVISPATYSNGQTIDTGQVLLSRVRILDANDDVINTGWTNDLDAGTVTVVSTAGWSQPVRVEWRIEDMVQCRDAQINGDVTFLPALDHDYPADGQSYCSSAVTFGDLVARVSLLFDLAAYDSTFSDVQGAPAPFAQYDDTNAPIEVTNSGTVTEKWQIQFTSTTAFRIIGQHLGVIDIGSTTEDFTAPINPNTDEPYFRIPKAGWGFGGWANGNSLRFNTVACGGAVEVIRTIRQGPPAGEDYSFQLLPRGDIDNPIP